MLIGRAADELPFPPFQELPLALVALLEECIPKAEQAEEFGVERPHITADLDTEPSTSRYVRSNAELASWPRW